MPLWFSLATHGTKRYAWAVEEGIKLTNRAGELITTHPILKLVREPSLSCVLYRRKGWSPNDYRNWTCKNHADGFALVTPTKWKTANGYEAVSRFCVINPATTEKDIICILKVWNTK